MKTLDEAMACIMRETAGNEAIQDGDIIDGESLAAFGREVAASDLCRCYITACMHLFLESSNEDDYEVMMDYGINMFAAGISVGVAMEKTEDRSDAG